MVAAAFTFSKSGLYTCVLEKQNDQLSIKFKEKITLPQNHSTPEITEWFDTELNLIIKREKPDFVTYKLTINNITNDFVSKVFYGQAVLNLICAKSNIKIEHTSPSSIVNSKFKLPKGANLHEYIDNILDHPTSPWDSKMRDTALMALKDLK